MGLIGIGKKVLNNFKSPKHFKLTVSSVYQLKGDIIVTFSNKKKSKFSKKYSQKLLKGNLVEFYGRENKIWINPIKEPKLKVIKHVEVEKVTGFLEIKYVSRFMNDDIGEYVYLPKCKLSYNNKIKHSPALIYLDKVGLKSEKDGVFQGYGKIKGSFSILKDIVSVDDIENFKPDTRVVKEKISLSDVQFHIKSLSVKNNSGTFNCPASDVPFSFTPSHNTFKNLYTDMFVLIEANQRRLGKVRKEGNKWIETITWVQDGKFKWDFSNIDNSKIAKKIKQQKMDEEYEKLLEDLRELKEFISFSDLKEKFKKTGRNVSNKDLSEMFFHPGYDEDTFHALEEKAIETFVDNLSFIFKIPSKIKNKNLFIWEVPNMTLATYLFSDILSPEQLFSRIKETKRMDIRTNKEVQKALGFEGFIVHSNFNTWNEKFQKFLK